MAIVNSIVISQEQEKNPYIQFQNVPYIKKQKQKIQEIND